MHESITLFLCGDVMLGRGVDQVLAQPVDPRLYERWIGDAREYVMLAEERHGPVPRAQGPEYPWGDALALVRAADVRIVNLETAITRSEDPAYGKEVLYRMSPENAAALSAAEVDVCALANNHVLDWGVDGLQDTLGTLRGRGIGSAGAGMDLAEAMAPAVVERMGRRVLVWSLGHESSGIPERWAATDGRPGVWLLPQLGRAAAEAVATRVLAERRPGDVVVVSIHWGPNWGYRVATEQLEFARQLASAGVDVVHGHSSHHAKAFEVFDGKLILYGAGDLINDYEGIRSHEAYRGDLGLLYFLTLAGDGRIERLRMVPMRMRRFRLERAPSDDVTWLSARLTGESASFGTGIRRSDGELQWVA